MMEPTALSQAQLAATDCSITARRILRLLDRPEQRASVPAEILQLQKDYARLLAAADQLGIAP